LSSAVSSTPTSANFLSGVASGLAVPTPAVSGNTDQIQNILSCNQALVGLGSLMAAGANA
jgi:hypothetical protein